MGILIFSLAALIGSVLLAKYTDRDDLATLAVVLLIISTVVSCTSTIMIVSKPLYESRFDEDYMIATVMASAYKTCDVHSDCAVEYVSKRVEDVNIEIEKNKKYAGNFFLSAWYSKKIASYEPIELSIMTFK